MPDKKREPQQNSADEAPLLIPTRSLRPIQPPAHWPSTDPNRTILVDMDNTVANFSLQVWKAEERLGLPHAPTSAEGQYLLYPITPWHDKRDQVRLWKEMDSPGFYSTMEPLPEAVKAVKWLIDSGFDVCFCTLVYPVDLVEDNLPRREKREWISRIFGPKMASRIIFEGQKQKCPGAYLIDDHPRLMDQAETAIWFPILVRQAYNTSISPKRIVRVPTMLDDIRQIFAKDGFSKDGFAK